MKNKIFGSIAILAIAAIAAFNMNINANGLSEVSLSNVEALASESSGTTCYQEPTGFYICSTWRWGWYCPCWA
jgi:hypothetical protein